VAPAKSLSQNEEVVPSTGKRLRNQLVDVLQVPSSQLKSQSGSVDTELDPPGISERRRPLFASSLSGRDWPITRGRRRSADSITTMQGSPLLARELGHHSAAACSAKVHL
jgi:hypothetical protein